MAQQHDDKRCGYHALINAALMIELLHVASKAEEETKEEHIAKLCTEWVSNKLNNRTHFWIHHNIMLKILKLSFDPKYVNTAHGLPY